MRGGKGKTAAATEAQRTRQTMEEIEAGTDWTGRAQTGKAATPPAIRRRQSGQPVAYLTPTAYVTATMKEATAEAAEA